MRSASPLRHAVIFMAGLACALTGLAPGVRAEDRFRLDVRMARQAERYQSHEADSLGLSFSASTVGIADCEFRVMDLPLRKGVRPIWQVFGTVETSSRVFVAGASASGAVGRTVESPMLQVRGGTGLAIPLGIVDGTRGALMRLRYEGGVVISTDSGENFLQTSVILFGFERAGGVFDGSIMETGYGHNDLYGSQWAAKRWCAHMLLMAGLGPRSAPARGAAALDADPDGGRRPLRTFLELTLETDGRPGPDSIGLRLGLALDAGSILSRTGGAVVR